jgi:hypothetical protein
MPHAWEASYPPECRWDARIEPGTLPGFLDEIAETLGRAAGAGVPGGRWSAMPG